MNDAPHVAEPGEQYNHTSAITIGTLQDDPIFVLWQREQRGENWTKPPFRADGSYASTTDPATWTSLTALLPHLAAWENRVGINLAPLSDGTFLGGADFDGAVKEDDTLEEWAEGGLQRFGATYCEYSPSGSGLHVLFRVADCEAFRALLGDQWHAAWPQTISDDNLGDKAPKIELDAGRRYYTVTGNQWSVTQELRLIPIEELTEIVESLGDRPNRAKTNGSAEPAQREPVDPVALTAKLAQAIAGDTRLAEFAQGIFPDRIKADGTPDRSARVFRVMMALKGHSFSYSETVAVLEAWDSTRAWVADKGCLSSDRELLRHWDAAPAVEPRIDPCCEFKADTSPRPMVEYLCVHSWVARDVAPVDRLLGDWISTTARVFVVGRTGLGKTMLGLAIASACASGTDFLHWHAHRKARVLYIDGEMPEVLIKERAQEALQRSGGEVPRGGLLIYGRDSEESFAVLFPGLGAMPPLNTPEGFDWLKRLIDSVGGVDLIIFDNVQSLISGVMKEEETWNSVKDHTLWLTKQKIGQLWFDHTGHAGDHQYGASVKAWGFSAVGFMSPLNKDTDPGGDLGFKLSFEPPEGKARHKTPANWQDYATVEIRLARDQWSSQRCESERKTDKKKELTLNEMACLKDIRKAIAVELCMDLRIDEKVLREHLRGTGRFDLSENGNLSGIGRRALSRTLISLKNKEKIEREDGKVWVI